MNAISIHLYIKGKPGTDACLEAARYTADNSVSAVWMDVSDRSSVDLCGTLASETPLSVIAVVQDPSLIGEVLDTGARGIAVRPAWASLLAEYKTTLLQKGTGVFLLADIKAADAGSDDREGGHGSADAGHEHAAPADAEPGIPEAFFSSVNETVGAVDALKKEGIDNIYLHIHHSDPVLLFNVSRFVKNRFGTRHVVSMATKPGRERSLIHNSLSLGSLFHERIGDVLLIPYEDTTGQRDTGHRLESLQKSILFAIKILGSCKLFPKGYTIISCPTCGRCRLDLLHITREIDKRMKTLEEQFNSEGKKLEDIGGISVAVMGCNVNGPGEARNADIGIAGRNNKTGVLFKNGKPFKSLPEKRLVSELIKHTKAIIERKFELV